VKSHDVPCDALRHVGHPLLVACVEEGGRLILGRVLSTGEDPAALREVGVEDAAFRTELEPPDMISEGLLHISLPPHWMGEAVTGEDSGPQEGCVGLVVVHDSGALPGRREGSASVHLHHRPNLLMNTREAVLEGLLDEVLNCRIMSPWMLSPPPIVPQPRHPTLHERLTDDLLGSELQSFHPTLLVSCDGPDIRFVSGCSQWRRGER